MLVSLGPLINVGSMVNSIGYNKPGVCYNNEYDVSSSTYAITFRNNSNGCVGRIADAGGDMESVSVTVHVLQSVFWETLHQEIIHIVETPIGFTNFRDTLNDNWNLCYDGEDKLKECSIFLP